MITATIIVSPSVKIGRNLWAIALLPEQQIAPMFSRDSGQHWLHPADFAGPIPAGVWQLMTPAVVRSIVKHLD